MSKRLYQPKPDDVSPLSNGLRELPITEPVGVYYRQSTQAQVGNISTLIQTVDMKEYLKQRGWPEAKILMIDMDEGVSGTKKIDERKGMRTLFQLITDGQIKTVACQDEDRLFRDVTQIQVNIFIEACRQNSVLVITPSMVYDFAHEQLGSFHARQFRFKCEMAAEYINSVILGKLNRAKKRLVLSGCWAGQCMPPGFMVDMRKTLQDGSNNGQYRRFVPFEPYAEVINEYYQLFLSYAGNLRLTQLHIQKHGPYYPDPEECPPPAGFKVVYQLHRYGNGYGPARTGLLYLLTNAAYIGHWCANKTIVQWNNHPAIVPIEVFVQAFNYLSPVSLDGTPNPDYDPLQEHARPAIDEKRPVERPLCAGMIVSKLNGRWRNVGVNWNKQLQSYRYLLKTADIGEEYLWSKNASSIDEAISSLAIQTLQATFASDVWEKTLTAFQSHSSNEHKVKASQREALERVMERQIAILETLTTPEMIQAVEARFKEAKTEHARLTEALALEHNEERQIEALKTLRKTYAPALENWPKLRREEKRIILRAFIRRIEATPLDDNGLLQLVVYWRDGSKNSIVLRRTSTVGRPWSQTEIDELLALVDTRATQLDIAAAFPDRTWLTLRCKVYDLRGRGALHVPRRTIFDEETYETYLVRLSVDKPTKRADAGARWTVEETSRLLDLLDNRASSVELAAAFPMRRWYRIRAKIYALRGRATQISQPREIRDHETIAVYHARQAQTIDTDSVMDSETFASYSETVPGSGVRAACASASAASRRSPCAADRPSAADKPSSRPVPSPSTTAARA